MFISKCGIGFLGILVLALAGGCNKSDSNVSATGAAKQTGANLPVATVHWRGLSQLANDTNAANFVKLWRMPETERLKAQTLDKLALLPWGLLATNRQALTNYSALVRANRSASLLRLVLEDMVQVEWYLEIRGAPAAAGQLALAVRLKPERAGVWETNLATVLESLTGTRRTLVQSGDADRGWDIKAANSSATLPEMARHAQLIHSDQWTIFGLAPDQNTVFGELLAKLQARQDPFPPSQKSDWLEMVLELPRLTSLLSLGWDVPQDWPRLSLTINGDGKNVLTSGHLIFSKDLAPIEPWNIPTNIIREPLHSFTAVQGLKPWISSSSAWQNLHAGAPPNQLFCWAQAGSPFLGYAAAPLADAHSAMPKISSRIMDAFNPTLATNRMGKWEAGPNSDGVVWTRVPIINPFVQSMTTPRGEFLLAGLSQLALTNSPLPAGTLKELLSQPNVVYFDREITGPRQEAWLYMSQLFRLISRRNQLPPESSSLAWLRACAPLMGNSATTITKSGPTELTLARNSTLGLTAFELQFLADWLESPRFPYQLRAMVDKMPPFPNRRPGPGGLVPSNR